MQQTTLNKLSNRETSGWEKPAQPDESVSLEAVKYLFLTFQQRGLRYCHWKSNLRLEKGLHGQTDLDLLVDRQHDKLFKQLLSEHGVKAVLPAQGKEYPDIENYLGFDTVSGSLFHLHVHYQLVLGEQFVKNYTLPLEAHFLDQIRMRYGVKIPVPELEISVLSIRALLKYRDRDVIKDIFSIRSPGLPADILKEFKWLLEQTTMDKVAETVLNLGDVIPGDAILELLRTITVNPRNGFRLIQLRRRVRQALSKYQRYDRFSAVRKYIGEAWRSRAFLRFSPNRKMTLPDRGITLALVGADGAGKSTMAQTLVKWLSWKLDASVYYLGSKQASLRSKLLYLLFRMVRRGQQLVSRLSNKLDTLLMNLRQNLLYCHYLSIGHDRYRRFLAGQRRAGAGSIVIYDRYPLEASLDGPKIVQSTDSKIGRLARALNKAEQDIYRKFLPPDYFCILDVRPEVSLLRKPDHDRSAIETKSRAIGSLIKTIRQKGDDDTLVHIDANLPIEEVIKQLKIAIWRIL